MKCSRVLTFGLLTVTLSTATPAAAQPSKIDPRTETRMHFGSLYWKPLFQLQQLGVDTNVFNTIDDRKSDFTMTLTPQVKLWFPIARRAMLSSTSAAGLVYFRKYSSERSVDPALSVRGDLYLHKLTPYLQYSTAYSRQRPNFEIDARSRRHDSAVRTGVIYQLRPKVSIELGGYTQSVGYDVNELFLGTDLRQSLTRNERGFASSLRYVLTTKTTFVVTAETRRTRFNYSPQKNADGFRLTGGFALEPRALISGNIEAGVRHFAPLNPLLPGFTGLVTNAALSYTLIGATRLGVTGQRDIGFSFEPTQPYYVINGFGGSIRRQLVRDMDAIVAVNRTAYSYRTFGTSATGQARTDVSHTYSLDLGYRINSESRAGFVISKSSRSSNTATARAFDGFRFGFSVTYGFQ